MGFDRNDSERKAQCNKNFLNTMKYDDIGFPTRSGANPIIENKANTKCVLKLFNGTFTKFST